MKLLVMPLYMYLLGLVQSFSWLSDTNIEQAVEDWMNPSKRRSVEQKYGPIADWDTSRITILRDLFKGDPRTDDPQFNADISKWDVSNVYNIYGGTFDSIFLKMNYFSDPLFCVSSVFLTCVPLFSILVQRGI